MAGSGDWHLVVVDDDAMNAPRIIPHWVFPFAVVVLALVYVSESHAANGTFGKWAATAQVPIGCALTDTTLAGVADALIACANGRSSTHAYRRTGCSAPANGVNLQTQVMTLPSGSWSACANHSGFVVANYTCPGAETRVYDVNSAAGVLQACSVPGPSCDTDATTVTFFEGYDTDGDRLPDGGASSGVWGGTVVDVDGCGYTIDAGLPGLDCFSHTDAPTKLYCTYQATGTGSAAPGGAETPDTPDASSPCPSGSSYGTVNGIPKCVPSVPDAGTVAPAPTTTTSSTETVDNGDGTSTTTTTTTTPDGGTTVTTTIINNTTGQPSGSSTTTTSGTLGGGRGNEGATEQAQFCRDNPQSPLCLQSSWGGSCAAFACKGDAVQCAIAREQHTRNCQLYEPSSQSVFGDAIGAEFGSAYDGGAGDLFGGALLEEEEIDLSAWWTATDYFGGAVCPDPIGIDIFGNTIEISFAPACQFADLIRPLVIIFGFIIGMRIVYRGTS